MLDTQARIYARNSMRVCPYVGVVLFSFPHLCTTDAYTYSRFFRILFMASRFAESEILLYGNEARAYAIQIHIFSKCITVHLGLA